MKILVIGDSFVEGVGDDSGGWTSRLNIISNYIVTSSGIGGNNTCDILDRIPAANKSIWDLAILEIGLNDSRWRPSLNSNEISIDVFEKNIRKIIIQLQQKSNKVAVLGLTKVNEKYTLPYKVDKYYLNKNILEYDKIIAKVAKDLEISYIPINYFNIETDLGKDGVHPSPSGHKKIFESVLNHLNHIK